MNNQHAASQYDLDVEFAFIYAKDPKQFYKEKDSEEESDEEIKGENTDNAKQRKAGAGVIEGKNSSGIDTGI